MNLLTLLYFVFISIALTSIFAYGMGAKGPWGSFWSFFIVTLLAVVLIDVWIEPVGPYYKDIYWLPPLATGVFIALLLAATTPTHRPGFFSRTRNVEIAEEKATAVAIGIFFWIMLVFMLALLIAGLFYSANVYA